MYLIRLCRLHYVCDFLASTIRICGEIFAGLFQLVDNPLLSLEVRPPDLLADVVIVPLLHGTLNIQDGWLGVARAKPMKPLNDSGI